MPRAAALVVPLAIVMFIGAPPGPARARAAAGVDIIEATGGLPAQIVGQFTDPIGFVQTPSGEYLVLDRRQHTVYGIDAAKRSARRIIQIGYEEGRVLVPGALALGPDDIFAVADAPGRNERIQYFDTNGSFIGGFYLQSRVAPRLVIGPLVLNGVGSMQFTGETFLVNRPESGALVTEFDNQGAVVRQFGALRPTGYESNRDLHLALNIGLPLADPHGGYDFVFQTGVPLFRKYDAEGHIEFERHIEGPELDRAIQALPTTWPERTTEAGTYPLVTPLVRTAAVDPSGRLWVSLTAPYTYVYDRDGTKIRTVQFQAGGIVSPASLFFTPGGRLLVTPGCLEFSVTVPHAARRTPGTVVR
jgi:hypothetical protein